MREIDTHFWPWPVWRAELRKCDRSGSDGKGLGTAVAVVQYACLGCLLCLSVSLSAPRVLSGWMTCGRWSHGEWWGGRRSRAPEIHGVCLCGRTEVGILYGA